MNFFSMLKSYLSYPLNAKAFSAEVQEIGYN